jgi:hypothetical protein
MHIITKLNDAFSAVCDGLSSLFPHHAIAGAQSR